MDYGRYLRFWLLLFLALAGLIWLLNEVLLPFVAGFALAYLLFDVTLHPGALALGAGGWLVALALRAPVSMVLLKALKAPERVQPWVVASSGPLEELVRVGVLVLAGTSFSRAMSTASRRIGPSFVHFPSSRCNSRTWALSACTSDAGTTSSPACSPDTPPASIRCRQRNS